MPTLSSYFSIAFFSVNNVSVLCVVNLCVSSIGIFWRNVDLVYIKLKYLTWLLRVLSGPNYNDKSPRKITD